MVVDEIRGEGGKMGEGGGTWGVFGLKPIVPPIISTRDLQIERPRPVPLYRFVALLSNCVNGVNKLFTASNGIPTMSTDLDTNPNTI